MPKNRGPGGKGRKKAKGSSSHRDRVLVIASAVDEVAAEYAFVREVCGQGHYRVVCNDGKERLGVLRGNMRRRVWVRRNDVVLVTKRDYQDGKADIVHKYEGDDVRRLTSMGEISPMLSRMYNSFDAGADTGDFCEEAADDDMIVFDDDAGDCLRGV